MDLDGTLAYSADSVPDGEIGHPIPAMVDRVKVWLAAGEDVRIFTARANHAASWELSAIKDWCQMHVGERLEVTCKKDFRMKAIYDDRAVGVKKNTGQLVGEDHDGV